MKNLGKTNGSRGKKKSENDGFAETLKKPLVKQHFLLSGQACKMKLTIGSLQNTWENNEKRKENELFNAALARIWTTKPRKMTVSREPSKTIGKTMIPAIRPGM